MYVASIPLCKLTIKHIKLRRLHNMSYEFDERSLIAQHIICL